MSKRTANGKEISNHEMFMNAKLVVETISYESKFSFIFRINTSIAPKYTGWVLKCCVISSKRHLKPFKIPYKSKSENISKSAMSEEEFTEEVATQRTVYDATVMYDENGFCPYISLHGITSDALQYLNNIAARDEVTENVLLYLRDIFEDPTYRWGYMIMPDVSIEYETMYSRMSGDHVPDDNFYIAMNALARLLLIYKNTGIVHVDAHVDNVLCKRESREVMLLDFGLVVNDRDRPTNISTPEAVFNLIQRFAKKDYLYNRQFQSIELLMQLFPSMSEDKRYTECSKKEFGWNVNNPEINEDYTARLTYLQELMTFIESSGSDKRRRISPPLVLVDDPHLTEEVETFTRTQSVKLSAIKEQKRELDEQEARAQEARAQEAIAERDRERQTARAQEAEAEQIALNEAARERAKEQLATLHYDQKKKKFVAIALVASIAVAGIASYFGRSRKPRKGKSLRKSRKRS